jgi:hypothetical protein
VHHINQDWLEDSLVSFRKAVPEDEVFVQQMMETIMRPYAEQVFDTQKEADAYMEVNSVFDVEKTLILQCKKDGISCSI